MQLDYVSILAVLRPGQSIGIHGPANEYESFSLPNGGVMPTEAECIAAWPAVESDILAQEAQEAKRGPARAASSNIDIPVLVALAEAATGVADIRPILVALAQNQGNIATALGLDPVTNGGS